MYLDFMKPNKCYDNPPSQGPIGKRPRSYIKELPGRLESYSSSSNLIPGHGDKILDRFEVKAVCRNRQIDSLVKYATIMAWGGRNFYNYRLSLQGQNLQKVKELVEHLFNSKASHLDDFNHTKLVAEEIKGLGISFFTKLLFFLRSEDNAYILDKWTARSFYILFPGTVRLSSAGLPHPATTGQEYEKFCSQIDACVGPTGWGSPWDTGETVERTLFDKPSGKWRQFVEDQYIKNTESSKPPTPPNHGGVDNDGPNDDGDNWDRENFVRLLKCIYLWNQRCGLNLPEGEPVFHAPNRAYIVTIDGKYYQFIVNQNDVSAQIFFPENAVPHYANLLTTLHPQVENQRHVFTPRITSNSPRNNVTVAINCPAEVSGGFVCAVGDAPLICQSAVEAMNEIFEFFEPYF
jgi:hypothetical protein